MQRNWIIGSSILLVLLVTAGLGGGYLYGESIKADAQRDRQQHVDDFNLLLDGLGTKFTQIDRALSDNEGRTDDLEGLLGDIEGRVTDLEGPGPSFSAPPRVTPTPRDAATYLGDYFPPADFCTFAPCIPSFWDGVGYVIQCNDGLWSKSGGRQGACSSHNGVAR